MQLQSSKKSSGGAAEEDNSKIKAVVVADEDPDQIRVPTASVVAVDGMATTTPAAHKTMLPELSDPSELVIIGKDGADGGKAKTATERRKEAEKALEEADIAAADLSTM